MEQSKEEQKRTRDRKTRQSGSNRQRDIEERLVWVQGMRKQQTKELNIVASTNELVREAIIQVHSYYYTCSMKRASGK